MSDFDPTKLQGWEKRIFEQSGGLYRPSIQRELAKAVIPGTINEFLIARYGEWTDSFNEWQRSANITLLLKGTPRDVARTFSLSATPALGPIRSGPDQTGDTYPWPLRPGLETLPADFDGSVQIREFTGDRAIHVTFTVQKFPDKVKPWKPSAGSGSVEDRVKRIEVYLGLE